MKPNTIKILYWVSTIFFALLMVMDGMGGIMRVEAGQEVMRHLGYPMYVLSIFGVAKILGALAILQTKFRTIKEWAYAGFTFNFIGGAASRAFMGDPTFEIMMPIIALGILSIPYLLWKKVERLQPNPISATAALSY